jgi:hypothetical protein
MKTLSFLILILLAVLHTKAQTKDKFYINPNIGIVWNSYDNTNPNITGNENVANIFWDNDLFLGALLGYNMGKNLTIESGIQYHNAVNRVALNYEGMSLIGTSYVSFFEGFINIPLNIKYNINTGVKNLNIVPYLGLTLSTHTLGKGNFFESYNCDYDYISGQPQPTDTLMKISGYRPTVAAVLLNIGMGVEYNLLNKIIFTFYGNFTVGFQDINKLSVEVFLGDNTEYGDVIFKGNKFYMSGGIKIPFSFDKKSQTNS